MLDFGIYVKLGKDHGKKTHVVTTAIIMMTVVKNHPNSNTNDP